MALEQGQQVLLGQAELLRQQVALPGVHGHALGPGLPQPAAVGAGRIRGKIAAVVFDDPTFSPRPRRMGSSFSSRVVFPLPCTPLTASTAGRFSSS